MQWTGGGEQVDFFLDTEFIELDRAIELISLGVVSADGREFYAISTEFDDSGANDFVQSTVLRLLEPRDHPAWMSRAEMKDALVSSSDQQFRGSGRGVVPRTTGWRWLSCSRWRSGCLMVGGTPRTTSRSWSSLPASRSRRSIRVCPRILATAIMPSPTHAGSVMSSAHSRSD